MAIWVALVVLAVSARCGRRCSSRSPTLHLRPQPSRPTLFRDCAARRNPPRTRRAAAASCTVAAAAAGAHHAALHAAAAGADDEAGPRASPRVDATPPGGRRSGRGASQLHAAHQSAPPGRPDHRRLVVGTVPPSRGGAAGPGFGKRVDGVGRVAGDEGAAAVTARIGVVLVVSASLALPSGAAAQRSISQVRHPDDQRWLQALVHGASVSSGAGFGRPSAAHPGLPDATFTAEGRVERSCTVELPDTSISRSIWIGIDRTPPQLVGLEPGRPANANGWFNRPVKLTFVGSDATSGVASCSSTTYGGPDGLGVPICRQLLRCGRQRRLGLPADQLRRHRPEAALRRGASREQAGVARVVGAPRRPSPGRALAEGREAGGRLHAARANTSPITGSTTAGAIATSSR